MEFTNCVMCVEGTVLNPSTRRIEACETCHGTGHVTPNDICHCGRSCTTEKDGHTYCGNEECLKGMERTARYTSYYDSDWRPFHY